MTVTKNNLLQLREALLELHKLLLHSQKREYEKKFGKVESRGKLYSLVTQHKDFAWIRQLSELVIGLDEMLDRKQPLQPQNVRNLLAYTRKLLTLPSDPRAKTAFERRYHQALQIYPNVAIAHALALQLLRKLE